MRFGLARTGQATHEAASHGPHNRAHYAALVDKYFEYAHSTRVVMPFNTNHFEFAGDLIKTLRVMGSPT